MAVMSVAQTKAKEVGDDYVSTEHLLVGLADSGGDVAELLRRSRRCPSRSSTPSPRSAGACAA
jgi:ATP-dependent Clp protease ATP-binding subunit ClpB